MRNPYELTYDQYLGTRHWKRRRRLVLEKHPLCLACGESEDVIVHHVQYARFAERDQDLAPFCRICHDTIHWKLAQMFPNSSLGFQVTRTCDAYYAIYGKPMRAWWDKSITITAPPIRNKRRGRKRKKLKRWKVLRNQANSARLQRERTARVSAAIQTVSTAVAGDPSVAPF